MGPTGRYLVDQNGIPFLGKGDSGWALITTLGLGDAETYLADREAHGFNMVLVEAIDNQFNYGNTVAGGTWGPNVNGDLPFSSKQGGGSYTNAQTQSPDFSTPNSGLPSHVGFGCSLAIGTRERVFSPPPGEMAIYGRIAHHVATAFRCRRRLGISKTRRARKGDASGAAAEAIVDAEGRFVHAESEAAGKEARERIRAAAHSIAALRTKARRRSGVAALDVWHPLVDARWTLVERFEENGRRYVVARENQARATGLDMLTDRERQVVLQAALGFTNKQIAYALGISDSTVRVLMARAAGRMGVRTRIELLSHPSLGEIRGDSADNGAERGEPPSRQGAKR